MASARKRNRYADKSNLKRSVYAMVDPRDSRIYYVGCAEDLGIRLSQHYLTARAMPNHNPRKVWWLRGLKKVGLRPMMIALEEVPYDDPEGREQYWIDRLADCGAPLTNCRRGNPRIYVIDSIVSTCLEDN